VSGESLNGAWEQALQEALRTGAAERLRALITQLPAPEVTEHLLDLPPAVLARVCALLGAEALADLLGQVDAASAAQLLLRLSRGQAADVLAELPPDAAADVVAELPPETAAATLAALPPTEAGEVQALLAYAPQTVGGWMTPRYVAVRAEATVAQALAALRQAARAEAVSYVYVVDGAHRLVGVLNLRSALLADPATPVTAVMVRDLVVARADEEAVAAAQRLVQHHLLALPVIDGQGRLLGVLTADDAARILTGEATADFFQVVGTAAAAMARRTPWQAARLRLPALLLTMAIELLSGLVIAHYTTVLQAVILLASFMPIISAISGNVGLQAAAIVVRGLDTGYVTLRHWGRHLRRELLTDLLMAGVCGVVLGLIALLWSQHLGFGLVIGVSLACAMATAGLMGTLIPLVSKRLGFDPAATAGPFETAFQDVVGFAVFLTLAAQLLQWLR
jgi:magnesium transporter